MTSMTAPPVADVLEQLFRDAARTRAAFREQRRGGEGPVGPERRSREFFARAKDVHMAVSRRTGTLLYMLARTRGARSVVEFGTSFGVSLLHLAAAVKDNGGGTVIGTEFEPGKVDGARRAVEAAGLSEFAEIRAGDALETLRQGPDRIDLLFLDGAKGMYREVLSMLEPRLAPGALVVADNASRAPEFLDHVRSGGPYLSADVGGDVEVALLV
jgi:predicted O-methyltransferase YrrM